MGALTYVCRACKYEQDNRRKCERCGSANLQLLSQTQLASDPVALTSERKKQHGDWGDQSSLSAALKSIAHRSTNWDRLPSFMKEAIDMILVKVSRILTGDPEHEDHWDDIAGYAYLGKGGHRDGS